LRETFQRAGQVGVDLATVDWSATPLGPPEDWPTSLETAVRLVLTSRFPMWMAWGEELTFFCNDAYRRDTLGTKYPWALGRPASEVWSEVWPDVSGRVEHVLTSGEATWDEKLMLFLERSGYREETYHTFSYSPLVDDEGLVAGMLCVVSEDTEEVISRRRLSTLSDLGTRTTKDLTVDEAIASLCRELAGSSLEMPFTLTFRDGEQGELRLAGHTGLSDPEIVPRDTEGRPLTDPGAWSRPGGTEPDLLLLDVSEHRDLPTGGWAEPPIQAAVVALQGPHDESYGFLVVGLNPYRLFDDAYADFVDLVAGHVADTLTAARTLAFERRRAELADREHAIAAELQASLMPERSFDLDHLVVATYYRAGVEGTQVGGDWYDVIELASGRTAFVVGDVMGRGVSAAAVMGQIRSAVRAYAHLGLHPEEVLACVDGLVGDLGNDQIVTCVYAVFDPVTLTLRFANAGHLPPLVALPDGTTKRLGGQADPPLGVGFGDPARHEERLAPGSTVLLYTDGLVERRGEDLDAGIAALEDLLGRLTGPLDDAPEALVRARLPDGPDDDVAVLVARVDLGERRAR
jgi:serine phosphatase RsbU (regulator of sigma subunit)